jgi:adenylate cyclase
MAADKVKRKLTAILSADVKGYSRLMGADEVGTIRILQTYRGVISDLIQKKGGRVVDSPGDNVLAEFASVVDALESAVEIQRELKVRNADRSESRRMEFRIGVNLGDVVEEGERIYGDGVNIAARIEGLAEGGGICISGTAFDHIGKRLSLGYEYMGEQAVKNIEKPVRVYRVLMEPEQAGKVIGEKVQKRIQWRWAAAAVAVFVLVAGGLVWNFYGRAPKIEPASKEKMAFPLPDKPSIAVLPFVNISGDPKEEYLSDGLTEQIITVLSKVPRLFVVARDSTFTYKAKQVKAKQVSEDLGVRYVLEGSFQRSGDRVRITAQLIDALKGDHIWAESYDRDLRDIFALQDEITVKVLVAIQVKLTKGEVSLRSGKYYGGKQGLDCYLKIMEGNDLVSHHNTKDNNLARHIGEEALAMCPEVPMAYLLMAYVHSNDYWFGTTESPRESIEKAIELIQKALSLDDTLAEARGFLGFLYTQKREYEKGIAEGERSVALNPGVANVLAYYAMSLNFAGRSEEAIPLLQKAIRLNPLNSFLNYYNSLGNALMFTGRYEEAVSAYKEAIQRMPDYAWSHLQLAATYSMMGREKEAQTEAAELLSINPKFSLDFWAKTSLVRDQSIKNRIFNALRKAGLK